MCGVLARLGRLGSIQSNFIAQSAQAAKEAEAAKVAAEGPRRRVHSDEYNFLDFLIISKFSLD
jgi:hypothetical protein